MIIDKHILSTFESRYRATLINSLAGAKQTFLIGTKSKEGCSNLAIFNSLIHLGANPPLWGFICRPDVVKRDTLNNILDNDYYTINYVLATDFEKAHQTSAKYEKNISEFDACGFTECYQKNVEVPFVSEAPIKILMKFEQKINIEINNTILIIGSIEHIEIDDTIISEDGFVALDKANTLSCAGLDAYYQTQLIARLSYAKTDTWPVKI